MDTTYQSPGGSTIVVGAGGDLQAALNAANPGDSITINVGSTYPGIVLPAKGGSSPIHIRSSAALTAEGSRVTTGQAASFPKIEASGSGLAISADPEASYYRFINVEVKRAAGQTGTDLARLGLGTENVLADFPHHIIVDRCYLHGSTSTTLAERRGLRFAGSYMACIDSYLADFKEDGSDAQALAIYGGIGPFKVKNCFLEGATENILIGGVDVFSAAFVPQNIEICDNLLSKPDAWNPLHGSYDGSTWTIKNLFELKNCKRALIARNRFSNNWVNAQNGNAILFTVKNQGGNAPWSETSDITFTHNEIDGATHGMTISGYDNTYPSGSQISRRILVQYNLFKHINEAIYGDSFNRMFQLSGGVKDLNIDHNTGVEQGGVMIFIADASPVPFDRFRLTNNILHANPDGLDMTGFAEGNATIAAAMPGAVIEKNVFVGAVEGNYPANNFYPAALANVGFETLAGEADLRLASASAYKNAATDGTDIGYDPVGA